MSKRSPRVQSRSQFHSYWGEFAHSTLTPVPSTFQGRSLSVGGMALPNAPSWTGGDASSLERGDYAFVYDPLLGNLYTPWYCLSEGTPNGFNAVWDRVTPVAFPGGIRDAHVIVVAHQNPILFNLTSGVQATDALLRLNPQVAGQSADFVDVGDGAQLALALVAAQAMLATNLGRVDVRMRPCDIRLDTSFPIISTISIPENVRLIGAGSGLSRITGWSLNDQTVFHVQGKLSGWEISSPEPSAATSGASQGVVVLENATGSIPLVEDLIVKMGVSTVFARTQKIAIQIFGDGYGGPRVRDCYVRQTVDPNLALSHFALFGTDLIGIQASGVMSNVGASISDMTLDCMDVAVDVFGSNEVRAANIQGVNLFRYGYRVSNSFFPADNRGSSLSQASFTFHDTQVAATTAAVRIGFSQDGQMIGPSLTSVRARWPSVVSTNRHFLDVQTNTPGRVIRGLQAVNCTIDPSTTAVPATLGIKLDASGGGTIRGGITTSDISNATTVLSQTGSVLWEQAHLL